jgi:hypothetical protein
MTTTHLKDKLAATADKAKETATSALDAAGEAGRAARDEMVARASETLGTVRDAAADRAEDARDTIVSAGDRIAQSLQQHADDAGGVQSRILSGLADGVTTVTDGLRGRTLGDLLSDAQAYARRNPGAFAAGAAVAGFALARFLRSSARDTSAHARAAEATDRIYRDAARRTVDTLGRHSDAGPGA